MTFTTSTIERIRHDLPNGRYRYLLVDSAATQGTHIVSALSINSSAQDLLTLSPVNWKSSAAPVLVQLPIEALTAHQLHAWKMFTSQYKLANALHLIESLIDVEELAHALHRRMDVLLTDQYPMLLRFFDTRILSHLHNILTKQQFDAFLSISSIWIYSDRHGHARSLINENAQNIALQSPLILTPQQEALLTDLSTTDSVIHHLISQQNSSIIQLSPPEQFEFIDPLLRIAKQWNINEFKDQVSFCYLGLSLGPRFYESRPWSDYLAQMHEKNLLLTEFLLTLR